MAFERIDRLVTTAGFSFQAWDDRYSKGVWAGLGVTEDQVDVVRDLSSAGDLDMIPATEYVLSTEWLPYVTGKTLIEAMQKLEARLACLPDEQLGRGTQWGVLVDEAVTALYESTNERSWYGDGRPGTLSALPSTFELALSNAGKV